MPSLCQLVALPLVRDLLLCAKRLFEAAMVGRQPGLGSSASDRAKAICCRRFPVVAIATVAATNIRLAQSDKSHEGVEATKKQNRGEG